MKITNRFVSERFAQDVSEFCDKHTVRKAESLSCGVVSMSTWSRIANDKTPTLSTEKLVIVCNVIGKEPSDYFDRVLF